MIPVVTIDGPSGAGKGTICRLVAQATGYHLLDSGALYRLAAVASAKAGVDLDNEAAVAEVARALNIRFVAEGDATRVLLGDEDVSVAIRTEQAGMAASQVAAHPKVREALLQCQQDFLTSPGLVADGRDMGTVVFPDAPVKIFLTASAQARADRRLKQLQASGQSANYDTILADIEARDEKDSNRASAPLKSADDAVVLDSTTMDIQAVFERVMAELKANLSNV